MHVSAVHVQNVLLAQTQSAAHNGTILSPLWDLESSQVLSFLTVKLPGEELWLRVIDTFILI